MLRGVTDHGPLVLVGAEPSERLELYELRPACATLLMERGLPPHVVANQLGHTDGGALVQRLYGHPSERGMREQIAFGSWGADEEQAPRDVPQLAARFGLYWITSRSRARWAKSPVVS